MSLPTRLAEFGHPLLFACVCAVLAYTSTPSSGQSPGEWQKCTTDSDCTMIRGTCGPVAGNKLYVQQLQQKESMIAAQIRAEPKGPVTCSSWADDPYANLSVICNPQVHWCQVTYPPGKYPRLKPNE